MTDILLITEQSIKNLTNISDNMSGKLLLPAIRESQEINLREILGDALLDELKRQVEIDDVRETYGRLLLQCQYYLAYQSCANICMITSVKIDNAGLQRVSDEKMEPLPVSEVNQIHDYYQQKADFYCERLQHFLLQNKDDYPQLNTRQCNAINSNLYSSASCGIFLGGPRSKNVDKGYGDGLNSSKSQGVEKLDVELTENGTYDYKPKGYGYNEVKVKVATHDFTEIGYTDEESDDMNDKIDNDIQYSKSLLADYTNTKTYAKDTKLIYAPLFPTQDRTQFSNMFDGCSALTSVSALDTSKGTNFSYMFNGCSALTSVPALDTSKGTDFSYMFNGCSALTSVPALDTSKGTDFSCMFNNCYTIKKVILKNLTNVNWFDSGFQNCYKLEKVIVDGIENNFILPNLQTCDNLFQNTKLTHINFVYGNDVKSMSNTFYHCDLLQTVTGLHTENITSFNQTFSNDYELKTISTLDFSSVTYSPYRMFYMFYPQNAKMEHIDITGSISFSWTENSPGYLPLLDYNTIKGFLVAMSKCSNPDKKKTFSFDRTIQDQNNELTDLVASCTEKGWTVSGLTITQ